MGKKIFFSFLILLIATGILTFFFIYRPITEIVREGRVLTNNIKQIKEVFSQNDIDLLTKELSRLKKDYNQFLKKSEKIYWLSFIPYIRDFRAFVEAGSHLINASLMSAQAIEPYSDLIGFKKGGTSFVNLSAEERLHTAVVTLDKILLKIDPISNEVAQAENKLKKINLAIYPEEFMGQPVRERLETFLEQILGISSLFVEAKPLVENLPQILGKDKEKIYLVLFQNDTELRATGGFLTAYAFFRIKDGKMRIERSEDIYKLDESIPNHPPAPREIKEYHKNVNRFFIRDSNLSPDFPTSVAYFEQLYKNSRRKIEYDGIIAVDTKVLVDLLETFGDTEVNGMIFSARKEKRCDCPQVVYKLLDIVDRPTPYLREDRKGILGDLMLVLFYKAIGFSPSKYWGTLAQQMFINLREKHIIFYFKDKKIQEAIEKVNFAGRIREFNGDYLHVNNVNFAGAKSNLFVKKEIISETKIENNKIKREIVINFRNPYPHSDCNLERGGLCLNATLRNWIRVYVPKGSILNEFKGSKKKVNIYEDLGKTVFEGYLEVPTQGVAQARVIYTLPEGIINKGYRLLVQKQPGTKDQRLVIKFQGNKIFDGILNEDKEIFFR